MDARRDLKRYVARHLQRPDQARWARGLPTSCLTSVGLQSCGADLVQFHSMAEAHEEFRHMADIVDSVFGRDAAETLAGCTFMHDLIVVTDPSRNLPTT